MAAAQLYGVLGEPAVFHNVEVIMRIAVHNGRRYPSRILGHGNKDTSAVLSPIVANSACASKSVVS